MRLKFLIIILFFVLKTTFTLCQNTDNYDVDSISPVFVYSPNDYDEMFEIKNVKIFLYKAKSEKEFDITREIASRIEEKINEKFIDYIKLQKSGMIGIAIVGEKEIQKYLEERKVKILETYNRQYYGIINDNNERIVKIVFSNCGKSPKENVEYNLEKNVIEKFYNNVTY